MSDNPYDTGSGPPAFGPPGEGQRSPYPPTAYPGGPAYGPPGYPVGGFYVPQVNNQNATMALIFGLLTVAVCALCFIPAIIYGRKARAEIAASHGTQSGDGLALAGLIIGYVYAGILALAVVVVLVALVVTAFAAGTSG